MKYSNQSIKVIEAIENTMKKLDSNRDKKLIHLLNEYNNKLRSGDDYRPIVAHLKRDISWCVLENNLKVPNEVNELMTIINSLESKVNLISSLASLG